MITYKKAEVEDIQRIYDFCRQLIHDYENLKSIDYDKVIKWVRNKIECSIDEYCVIYHNGQKAGYFHFYRNDEGWFELDDLYVFPEFQNQGIGTRVIEDCIRSVNEPIMLYVFIRNTRAVSLYKRLGFEIVETVNGTRYMMKNLNSKSDNVFET